MIWSDRRNNSFSFTGPDIYYIYNFDFLEELLLQYITWRRWKLWKQYLFGIRFGRLKKKNDCIKSKHSKYSLLFAYDILTRGLHHNWKCAEVWPRGNKYVYSSIRTTKTICIFICKMSKSFCTWFLKKSTGPFIWTNLNPFYPRMLCAKFSWN